MLDQLMSTGLSPHLPSHSQRLAHSTRHTLHLQHGDADISCCTARDSQHISKATVVRRLLSIDVLVLLHLTTPYLGRYLSTTPCVPSSKIAEHSVSFTPYSVLTLLWRPVRSPPQLNGPTMCGGRGLFRPNASMRRNQANQLLIINGEVMGGRDMGCKSRFSQRGLAPISQHEILLALAQGLEPLQMAPWTCAEEAPTWNTHICFVLDSHRHLQMYLHLHSFALQSTTLKYHASAPFMAKAWDCTYDPFSITVLLVVDWASISLPQPTSH